MLIMFDLVSLANINGLLSQFNQGITGMNPKASCGVLYPPLRGIVQLTNFPTLRYGNWSFSNSPFFGRASAERR